MVVYSVVGTKSIEWALKMAEYESMLFVNGTGPESLIEAAELVGTLPANQRSIDYQCVENIGEIADFIGNNTVVVIEGVGNLLESMRSHDTASSRNHAIVNIVTRCRRSKCNLMILEPRYNHFLSMLLDVDIST